MSTHTPGPWKARIRRQGSHVTGPDGFSVAHVGTDANARLIAAAPDLLEACRLACLVMAKGNGLSYADRREAHEAVIAAIHKAEGTA